MFRRYRRGYGYPMRGGMLGGRLVIALVVAGIALGSYYFSTEENPITGEAQRVGMSADQEVALGLQSAPQMIQEFGGEHPSAALQQQVDSVGAELLSALQKDLQARGRTIPYPFEFHLLADDHTINAFALPGGQVFITYGLFKEFTSPAQLAGVLGHEIGHVLARHSAQQLAKQQLTQGLAGAAGVAGGTYDSARMAQVVASMVNMKFGRDDELEADKWGVQLMGGANYDPRAMIEVMQILDRSGGGGGPEFLSTHPKPANRIEYIQQVINDVYPHGVPEGMRR